MRAQGASPTRLVPDLVLHRGRFDLAHPSLHPPTNLLKSIVYTMSPQAITDVWVQNRRVVAQQRLTTLDQNELIERIRRLTRAWKAV